MNVNVDWRLSGIVNNDASFTFTDYDRNRYFHLCHDGSGADHLYHVFAKLNACEYSIASAIS